MGRWGAEGAERENMLSQRPRKVFKERGALSVYQINLIKSLTGKVSVGLGDMEAIGDSGGSLFRVTGMEAVGLV